MAGLPNYTEGSTDAIPDTRVKDISPTKRRNFDGVVQDYIPDPNRRPRRAKRNRQEQARTAYEQSVRRQEANRTSGLELAKTKLEKMNVATAVAFISEQPDRVKELYLVAEEQGQGRRSILSRFPKPGKVARGEPTSAENALKLADFKAAKAEARERRTQEISPAVPNITEADEAQTEASAEAEAQPEGEADVIQA